MLGHESLHLFPQVDEFFLMMMIGLGYGLSIESVCLCWGVSLAVMFGSILGLWTTQPRIPGHLGSTRRELPLEMWVSNLISHWLAIPTSSVPQFPQHILQVGRIKGGMFLSRLIFQSLHWRPFLITEDNQFRLSMLHYYGPLLTSPLYSPESFYYTMFHIFFNIPQLQLFTPNAYLY